MLQTMYAVVFDPGANNHPGGVLSSAVYYWAPEGAPEQATWFREAYGRISALLIPGELFSGRFPQHFIQSALTGPDGRPQDRPRSFWTRLRTMVSAW